jgi:hypothetical protein
MAITSVYQNGWCTGRGKKKLVKQREKKKETNQCNKKLSLKEILS